MAFRLTALLLSVAAAGLMLRRHLCLMPVISKEAVQLKAFCQRRRHQRAVQSSTADVVAGVV